MKHMALAKTAFARSQSTTRTSGERADKAAIFHAIMAVAEQQRFTNILLALNGSYNSDQFVELLDAIPGLEEALDLPSPKEKE